MNTENRVVLDFYSDYCMPCKMLSKDLDEISKDFSDIKFEKLNINDNYELTEKYNVMTVPTLVMIKNNEFLASYIGYKGKEDLKRFLVENGRSS